MNVMKKETALVRLAKTPTESTTIARHNNLIEAHYYASPQEQRLFLWAVSQAQEGLQGSQVLRVEIAELARPTWEARTAPFPHFVARDVFPSEAYRLLEEQFLDLLGRGFCEGTDARRFSRRMKGYDAYSVSLTRIGGPLDVFSTRAWHDELQQLTGLAATLDVSGALHHHKQGSDHGRLHNDLNPGWFVDNPRRDGVNLNDPKLCNYNDGAVYSPGVTVRECVRGVAMLFYLANPPWQPGDGGETALYAKYGTPVEQPDATVPPLNNSALVFECTPTSYHSFLHNSRSPRNSAIMWLHRSKAEAVARWGESKIVKWSKNPEPKSTKPKAPAQP